jgi:predicted nucleotidyltransferase
MNKIKVIEVEPQKGLEEFAGVLKHLLARSTDTKVYGGITYGSYAKGNAGPFSDLDALLFYKISLKDGVWFRKDIPRLVLSKEYKVNDPNRPLLYTYEARGKRYTFDIDFLPILKFKEKNGLLDSFGVHRVHDMMNILHGRIIPGFDAWWLKQFQHMVRKRFHWDEVAVAKHVMGMCRSQMKKLKAELEHKRINVIRALKLTTTGYYIAFNGLSMLKNNTWYQGSTASVEAGKYVLGEDYEFFKRAMETLRIRDEQMIKEFTPTDFLKPFGVLDRLHDEIDQIYVEPLDGIKRELNRVYLNSVIQHFYNLEEEEW